MACNYHSLVLLYYARSPKGHCDYHRLALFLVLASLGFVYLARQSNMLSCWLLCAACCRDTDLISPVDFVKMEKVSHIRL